MGSGRPPRVGSNPTTYHFEAMSWAAVVQWDQTRFVGHRVLNHTGSNPGHGPRTVQRWTKTNQEGGEASPPLHKPAGHGVGQKTLNTTHRQLEVHFLITIKELWARKPV
ncbi:hypothetical protein E2C01_019331 [Portunus trituberculatus]|uniref:Uncharacterized protein n=1 Tax=Portunus trituberculatus TaxID=210409 RepID=A0A5B7DYR5_PORTR|nr:hypothetical protein [Portunus trituberculatus]